MGVGHNSEAVRTLVLHPGRGAQDRAQAAAVRIAERFGRKAEAADNEAERVKLLSDAGLGLTNRRYSLRFCATERDLRCSLRTGRNGCSRRDLIGARGAIGGHWSLLLLMLKELDGCAVR